ncbi:MAG: serine hydrolase [Flavobacteriales bacterium]|nr:serine hydrolase [Flavobacteriales bacterium]MEB2341623.1 serine hydrolase [Flavobacteriia bacterium]
MRLPLIIPGLVLAGLLHGQATAPALDSLDRYLADAVVQFDQPGLAVGIVKDGALVWSKGYGKLDLAKPDPVTPQSIFHLASISKAFTATAIGLLVDDGKLGWDDHVQQHMPEFATADPYVSAHMTVTDLLCHRAGYLTFDDDLLWYGTRYTQPEIMARHAGMPLTYEFRTQFGYSNLMYIAAAQLIERVSGKTWNAFITERILQPLGMARTTVDVPSLARFTDVALPHVRKGQDPAAPQKSMPYQDLPGADGATGINSCVEDLAKWDAMWADEGKANGKPFISPATYRMLTANHLPMGGRREGAALGWFIEDFNGNTVITHSGGMPGFILNHAVVPDKDLAVIALGNGDSYAVFAVTNKVLDLYLGDGTADPVGRMIPRIQELEQEDALRRADRAKARQAKTKPSVPLDSLAATYTDKIYGDARIAVQDGKATLTLVPAAGLFSGPLSHWHHDTWQWHHNDPFLEPGYITFSFDTDHRVTGFKIDLHSPDFHFHKLDFKRP